MYSVEIRDDAAKAVEKLPRKVRQGIFDAIAGLAQNPRPHGCCKLQFSMPLYRIRVGDYRIVYTIEDKQLIVLVIRVGHRKEIYRKL